MVINCRIEESVRIVLHPDVDILIDKNEEGYMELRTPLDHHHIATVMAAQCAWEINDQSSKFWPFVRCLME